MAHVSRKSFTGGMGIPAKFHNFYVMLMHLKGFHNLTIVF